MNRDYGGTEEVVTFMPDSRGPLCHSVPIFRDDILEDSESFTVELHKVNEQLGYGLNPWTTRVVVEDRNSEFEAGNLYAHTHTNTYVHAHTDIPLESFLVVSQGRHFSYLGGIVG